MTREEEELEVSIRKSCRSALSGRPNASSGTNETYLVLFNKEEINFIYSIISMTPDSELQESIKESLDIPVIWDDHTYPRLIPLDKEGINFLLELLGG